MASTIEDLETAVLQLPEQGRARLARILLFSLGETAEEGAEQAWIEEAQHRYEEIQSGDVEAQDSDEVFREVQTAVTHQEIRKILHTEGVLRTQDLERRGIPGKR